MVEYGFDLTDFGSAEVFKKLLLRHGLTKYSKTPSDYGTNLFIWSTNGLKLITGNNPITGEYSNPKQRSPEKGYASYIGIEGDSEKVLALANDIKKTTRNIKGENPTEREFI